MKKFFRRALTALLIVAGLLTATIVGAAVQMFDGKGEWNTNDDDNQQIAMSRAQQRAERDAQKKAGVYLKTFSRMVNLELADDVISAVTNNIIEIVGDVHFDKKIIPLSNSQTTILYVATLKAKIDPDGLYDFVKRDGRDKVTIVQQNTQLQDAIQKNDELSASLTEQYNRATSQAEKDRIRKQMNDAERDFLASQKLKEGNKLAYAKDYYGAIKFYDEAIQLKPNYAFAYNNRGVIFDEMKQYESAIQDYTKAIELDPKNDFAYTNRANAYAQTERYEQAIRDYGKALQINPYNAITYKNRGLTYGRLDKYELAIQDFNKALEIHPYLAEAYLQRGVAYALTENFKRAIDDFSEYIKLNPNNADVYNARGICYAKLGETQKAQADFDKAAELGYSD